MGNGFFTFHFFSLLTMLLEAAGVEPASKEFQDKVSTSLDRI